MPKVIFYDNHLLVLSKPSGWLTQPSGLDVFSLEDWGKKWIKEKFEKRGAVFLEAVHRIDKPVSGIVLFARTSKGLSRVQENIRNHQFKKTYLATVEGHLEKKEGILEDVLIHDSFCARSDPKGKPSRLSYKVIEERREESDLEINLETGRYHQIRFQLGSRGHPVVGDVKYGSSQELPGGNILLHHKRLETLHPISREKIIFEG